MEVKDFNRDPRTPPEVVIKMESRPPATDPTLGVVIARSPAAISPARRLVVVGDSISHGFQSGAI
jgi:hypothetical protein